MGNDTDRLTKDDIERMLEETLTFYKGGVGSNNKMYNDSTYLMTYDERPSLRRRIRDDLERALQCCQINGIRGVPIG